MFHLLAQADPGNSLAALQLSAMVVLTLTSVVIPVVTAFVTKHNAPSWLKSVVLMFLTAVSTLVTTSVVANGTAIISKETLIYGAYNFVVAVGLYFGWWKGVGVNNRTIAPNFGLTAGQKK